MRLVMTVAMVGCVLVSCGPQSQNSAATADASASPSNQPQDRCVSDSTIQQLKVMTFDAARRLSSSDPVRMNDLERQSGAALEMPLLVSHDAVLDRTVCSGRLRIDVPVGARSIFGPDELLADITYSMQPAADGTGLVYQVNDFGRPATVIGYADLSRFNQSRSIPVSTGSPIAGPSEPIQQKSSVGDASFDCRRAGTAVERMICTDPDLGDLDRQMASAYNAKRRAQPGSGSEQVAWIAARNKCSDASCLYDAYESRIAQLAR